MSQNARDIKYVIVIDQNGTVIQKVELTPGTRVADWGFIAVNADQSEHLYIPSSTLLAHPGAFGEPSLLPLPAAKAEKELFLGTLMASTIAMLYGIDKPLSFSNNPADPPDLVASSEAITIGVELCELVYPERYANDAQMTRFENAVRRQPLAKSFTDYQLHFTLRRTKEGALQLPKERHLLDALRAVFEQLDVSKGLACIPGTAVCLTEEHLPSSCKPFLHTVIVDNIGASSSVASESPIMRFENHSQPFSREILRSIVSGPIRRKLTMKLRGDNVLLVWSRHGSFLHCISATCDTILEMLLNKMRSSFRDVIYLHRSTKNIACILMTNRSIPVKVTENSARGES